MKGLRIIPLFVGLILFSYLGVLFVEANRTEVVIAFGTHQTNPTAVGFVVLTSVLVGMILSGTLCAVEILALYIRLGRARRRLTLYEEGKLKPKTGPIAGVPPEPLGLESSREDLG
jgi:uncharacterized integral membrane protein